MLFRQPPRVYAVLHVGILVILAGFATSTAAQDDRNAALRESSSDLRVRTGEPSARQSRQTVKDVLGRDVFMPGEYEWFGVLPVHFLYDEDNRVSRFELEQDRSRKFLNERTIELDSFRNSPRAENESEAERKLRLQALVTAIQTYRDPGPALSFASSEQTREYQRGKLALIPIVWIDTDNDGRLDDETGAFTPCGKTMPLSSDLTAITGQVFTESAWRRLGYLIIGHQNPRSMSGGYLQELLDRGYSLPSSDRPTLDLDLIRSHSNEWSGVVDAFNDFVLLDGSDRKSHLPEIVAVADSILELPFVNQTINDRRDERLEDPVQVEIDRLLSEVVYRKGRALGYMELPSVLKKHPIVDPNKHNELFERNYKLLLQLNQYDRNGASRSNDYGLLSIRFHRRRGEYGAALHILNTMSEHVPPQSSENFWHTKKRRDLYRDLGWTAWADYENRWMLRKYPLRSALLINQSTPQAK